MVRGLEIPGLTRALKEEDLEESRNIYNNLPDDSRQPEILQAHIHDLAALFVRHRVQRIFGIHLVHAHFVIPEKTALLGANYDAPRCRWAKATAVQAMDLGNMHGHIFVLTENVFHPYEYQVGPAPDMSQVDGAFILELADYLNTNNLAKLLGLQIIDPHPFHMLELVLPEGTIMFDVSNLKGCVPARQTGWTFMDDNGEPRVCQPYETHARHANGHDVFNAGAPLPKLDSFQDVKHALKREGILCQ